MFAYIPARGGSTRIPRKNIRPLAGKPILGRVIEALKALSFIDAVHVSTDDAEIADVAMSFGAVCLAPRSADLADSQSGFTDLIRNDIPRYVEANDGDSEVLFVLATAALVPSSIYEDAWKVYAEDRPEILMSCEPYDEPIWWAFEQKADGFWFPVFPDKVLTNSQDLPPSLTDSGLFYMFDQKIMSAFDCHKLADRLQAFVVPHEYRCNVDNEEDWERLEWKFERLARSRGLHESA